MLQTSRGCSCLRSALPLARARSAPTMLTEQTIGGYGIPAIPTHPPNYLPTEPTEPTEVYDTRYSPTDCTDVHRLGGYGILPYPRRHQTIFPQNPTQPNHLCASVRICGRLFSTRNFCEFREFRGRSLRNLTICGHLCASVGGSSPPEASVNSVGEPYAAKPSVSICEICGRLFYAKSFCEFREFREFRGRTLRSLTIYEHR